MAEPEHIQTVLARWLQRREDFRQFKASVDGESVCEMVIADLRVLAEDGAAELLTLEEAARRSGYTADHLGSLVRSGKIQNHGRKNAPRVRACDVPKKSNLTSAPSVSIVAPAERRRIARSVLSDTTGGSDAA